MKREQIINQYISVYEGHAMEKEELEIMLNGFADDIVNNLQPSLPSNFDEVAEEWAENEAYGKSDAEFDMAYKGFKAGAEWMKRKMMEGAANAYILKSYNPVTEQGEPTLHAIEIELVYEDEGKPYLIAGQRARIIILPKEEK